VDEKNIPALSEFLNDNARVQLQGGPQPVEFLLDGVLSVRGVTPALASELEAVGPYGSGNDEPRFAIVDAQVVKADIVGSGHVRCILSGRDGGRLKAIAFRSADSELGLGLLNAAGRSLYLAGMVRADNWQGRNDVQFMIEDACVAK
ncbi:MAG: hypothetical protein KDE14_14110, partial [Rhodobacteraceae bacterium]|nr:hypothetical protein [Paracoccaceae bacterium]